MTARKGRSPPPGSVASDRTRLETRSGDPAESRHRRFSHWGQLLVPDHRTPWRASCIDTRDLCTSEGHSSAEGGRGVPRRAQLPTAEETGDVDLMLRSRAKRFQKLLLALDVALAGAGLAAALRLTGVPPRALVDHVEWLLLFAAAGRRDLAALARRARALRVPAPTIPASGDLADRGRPGACRGRPEARGGRDPAHRRTRLRRRRRGAAVRPDCVLQDRNPRGTARGAHAGPELSARPDRRKRPARAPGGESHRRTSQLGPARGRPARRVRHARATRRSSVFPSTSCRNCRI